VRRRLCRGENYEPPAVEKPRVFDLSQGLKVEDEPKGSWGKLAELDCYITGKLDSRRVLLAFPDLFNLKSHPTKVFQVRQQAGSLASRWILGFQGWWVVLKTCLQPHLVWTEVSERF
jgi:hypothetical protein